jgi:D-arabinitol dehydrogenase (NADP+)
VRSVVYGAAARLSVREVPDPTPGAGEVRIKVDQVGLCGTDVHIHHGDFNAVFPLTPGHEVVGTIDQLGRGVETFTVGEQVTVNPNVPCGRCSYCRSGRLVQCENPRGYGTNIPGFFSDFIAVPAQQVFSVEGLPRDTAVFTEPAACAMHGLEVLGLRPGSSALVLGSGPTGLLLAQLLATGGAASVTVASPRPAQLATATALGADHVIRIDQNDPDANLELLRDGSPTGDGYDYVIEATGATTVANLCVPLARNGGTVLIYGVTRADEILSYHPFDVLRREITIKGSFAEMTSFGAAIAALRTGRVKTDGIITHRFRLEQYGDALARMQHGNDVHKIVIDTASPSGARGPNS